MIGIDALALYNNIASNFTTYKNYRYAIIYNYSPKKRFFIDTEVGCHLIAADTLRTNIVNYSNQGAFGKVLIGFQLPLQHLRIGGGLGVSSINQKGFYHIGGEYFQPYEFDLKNKQITTGIIFYFGTKFRAYKNLFIGIDIEFYTGSWQTSNNSTESVYSTPGYLHSRNGNLIIKGFDPSIKILYNFP